MENISTRSNLLICKDVVEVKKVFIVELNLVQASLCDERKEVEVSGPKLGWASIYTVLQLRRMGHQTRPSPSPQENAKKGHRKGVASDG